MLRESALKHGKGRQEHEGVQVHIHDSIIVVPRETMIPSGYRI